VNLSSIDLNLLVVLDALLAEASVTRAARRVGLSQPAVSNALARLRDVIGDPLLVRSGRGLVATPRALALAAPVHRALGELSTVLDPPAPFDPAHLHRTFVVVMPDIAELVLVPPLVARLRRDAPRVDLRIVPGPGPGARSPAADGPDLAISMLAGPAPHTARLFELRFVCLVRHDHPRVGRRMSLERFLELEHVLVAPGGTAGGVIDDLLARRNLARRVALTLAHFFSAALVVSRSDLVMSATSVLAEIAEDILPVRSIPHPLGAPAVTIGLRWHPRHEEDAAHRWLRNLVSDVAANLPARERRAGSRHRLR